MKTRTLCQAGAGLSGALALLLLLPGPTVAGTSSPRHRQHRPLYHRSMLQGRRENLINRMLAQAVGYKDTSNLAFVGGIPIQRVHTPWVGRSPQQRAATVQQRLNNALATGPIMSRQITTGPLDGDWVVFVKGHRLLTADPATARYNHSTQQALAEQWATRMRVVLPALTGPKG